MHGFDHEKTRPMTFRVMDLMEQGALDPRAVADMALMWLSEDSVRLMMQANDIPTTEEWTPDNADFNDPGSRHHY